MIRRREVITLIGGAAAWPVAARAQPGGMRRIAMLMGLAENDAETGEYVRQLKETLQALGWSDGQNLEFTYRYAAGSPERARALAGELVALQPDAIVGHTTPVAAALQQATHSIPIIFVSITDPVVAGFVASLARPGGNLTGFTNYEFSMGAKWLEILKEIAPGTAHVSLMLNPDTGSYYVEYLRSVETVALASGIRATLAPVRNTDEIERTIAGVAREPVGV